MNASDDEAAAPASLAGSPPIAAGSRRGTLVLIAATTLLLLPFLTKPLHIDDPMYVWTAQQIRSHPLDPYGFEVNWHGVAAPMPDVMKNPPLVSYYLAAASLLLGWSEAALHLALLLPAIGVILGVYALARELAARPMLAALATLSTPVFLVSASTLMSDVAMLCGYVWAIALWVRGLRQERALLLVAASLLVALATLTKYFGITLLPLLIAFALLQAPGQWRRWLPPLALPITLLVGYELGTRALYGRGLLLEAADYATGSREVAGPPLALRWLNAFSFVGGGALTVSLVFLAAASRRQLAWAAATLVAILLALVAVDPYAAAPLRGPDGIASGFLAELTLFVGAGLMIVALAGWQAARRPLDPVAALLALWLVGTLVFAAAFNWTVNGRAVLAAAPAGALLVARHVERASGRRRGALGAALALGGMLSLACVYADTTHARAARDAALSLHSLYGKRPGTIWFLGHWGFQHYMQQLGAQPVDGARPLMRPGDLLVKPRLNSSALRYAVGGESLPLILNLAVERLPFLALTEFTVHAGFYTDLLGPLPFGFGAIPPDYYQVMEIRGRIEPIPLLEASPARRPN